MKALDNVLYLLFLSCLLSTTFALDNGRLQPHIALKQLLFHLLVLLASFLMVTRAILTDTAPIRGNGLSILIGLYLSCNILSYLVSAYSDEIYLVNLTLLIVFFFLTVSCLNSDTKFKYLLYTITVIVTVSSIYALFQIFGVDFVQVTNPFSSTPAGQRVYSFFGNPNLFAAFLVVNLPWLWYGFLTSESSHRLVFGTCAILAVAVLLLTGSRAAILGLSVSAVLFAWMNLGKASRRSYAWALSITTILVIAGFLYTSVARNTGIGALDQRQYWWHTALQIVEDHPVFGTGVGSFNVYYPEYRTKSDVFPLGESHTIRLQHAHNEFIEILSDLGMVGLLLFFGILATFFYHYYREWDPKRRCFIAASCCAVVGILIHSLYSVNLRFFFVALFLWLNLALQSAALDKPRFEKGIVWSAGKVTSCLLFLSLALVFFFNHSLRIYRSEYHVKEGLGSFSRQNYLMAEQQLRNAVDNHPQDKRALYYLAISQYRFEKFTDSNETLSQLARLDPNYIESHYWFANNYYRLGLLERARQEYYESLRLNNIYGPSHYGLGLIFLREHDNEKALYHFERAYAFMGPDAMTRNIGIGALRKLIEIHQLLGNRDKALDYIQQLRALVP